MQKKLKLESSNIDNHKHGKHNHAQTCACKHGHTHQHDHSHMEHCHAGNSHAAHDHTEHQNARKPEASLHYHGHTHGHCHAPSHGGGHSHEHGHCHAHEHAEFAQPGCTSLAPVKLHKGAKVLTLRASSGVAGDMMLSGLAAVAGLSNKDLANLSAELGLPALDNAVLLEERSVNGISGVGCRITLPHEHAHRSLRDIEKIIHDSAMPQEAKDLSLKAFSLLAEAEAAVHGAEAAEVTFHEVGALDSILDTCLTCRIFTILQPDYFICSPLPMADGVVKCAHGLVHSPAPAVLRLLEGVPVCEFSGQGETVTPTAISLLKALAASFGPWPRMTVEKSTISYGGKVFKNAPNGALWVLGTA